MLTMQATIRISSTAHRSLAKMASKPILRCKKYSIGAVENERRRLLLERTNLAYSKLRQNKKAWKAWRTELRQSDATLNDGT